MSGTRLTLFWFATHPCRYSLPCVTGQGIARKYRVDPRSKLHTITSFMEML